MDEAGKLALQRAAARAASYRERVLSQPPRPQATPEQLRALFCGPTPEERQTDWTAIIDQLADAAEPGLMGIVSPRFFGWVMGGSHPVGVAADWLTSAWGQNAGLYHGTPAAAVAEEAAAAWLLDILHLPTQCSVGFVTGATMANFTCLAAARDDVLRRVGWDVEERGLQGSPTLHVCIGEEAHTTVFKALHYLGIGRANLVPIETDDNGRMQADALQTALRRIDGPKIVAAQAGQINTGAFDPFQRIAPICRDSGAWLHVDAAFGLWARACPEKAHLAAGLEDADSWSTDAHKWLQAPYDCGLAIVRDAKVHKRAMAISASYLPEEDTLPQPSHYTPELSRRARGFAIWAIIRALGRRGIAELVSRHCAVAKRAAALLAQEPGVEILNDVVLNQVAVGFGQGLDPARQNEAAKAVVERVQRANRVLVGGADWRGRWIVRISVTSNESDLADADLLATEIISAWRSVRNSVAESLAS